MEDKISLLSDIKKMLDDGLINETEFNSLKKEILGDIQSKDLSSSKNSLSRIAPVQNKQAKGLTESNKEIFDTEQNRNVKPNNKKNITKGKYKYLFISLAILGLVVVGYSIYLVSQKNLEADESLSQTTPIANSSSIITPSTPSQPFVDTFKRPFVETGKRRIAEQNNSNDNSNDLKEIAIGPQIWSTKNLNVSHFRNGDSIPQVTSGEDWNSFGEKGSPAWCYYNNDPENGKKYGKLYNWYAVNDPRGLAPIGWHIPDDAEWTVLIDFLGGETVAPPKLKSTNGGYKNDYNGSNSSGFSALPGGCRSGGDGGDSNFFDKQFLCSWWSSNELNNYLAMNRHLRWQGDKVYRNSYSYSIKKGGMAVRCLRD